VSTQAIFFDLDGTLVDSLPGIEYAVDLSLSRLHLFRPGPLRPLIGPPIRSILKSVAGDVTDADLDRLEAGFREAYDSTGWRKTTLQNGARTILERLSGAGLLLFLVTNKPLAATRRILDLFDLADYFVDIAARDSRTPVFSSKQEMIEWLLHRHVLDAGQCMMVGDTMEDYHAACGAGMKTVLMAHGYGAGVDCKSAAVLHDFAELTTVCMGVEA
jgi:phosphoglycolate phosphatase